MITLRAATDGDVEHAATIYRAARIKCLPFLPDLHSQQEDLEFFQTRIFDRHNVIMAELDGQIAGYSASHEGWLDHLYVFPDFHGAGVGTALLDDAKAHCNQLRLWVFQKNERAIRFYVKHSFRLLREADGSGNPEGEPDAVYVWSRTPGLLTEV
jgi:putative acetyltransferase